MFSGHRQDGTVFDRRLAIIEQVMTFKVVNYDKPPASYFHHKQESWQ